MICALGQSAVGKSTLLNAIVAGNRSILPAGGIGPLTALATEVSYCAEPFFTARYRDEKQLRGFWLQLQRSLKRPGAIDDLDDGLMLTEGLGYPAQPETPVGEFDIETVNKSFEETFRQMVQLVCGNQFAKPDPEEISTAIRAILGYKLENRIVNPAYQACVAAARAALDKARVVSEVTYNSADNPETFEALLRDHIGGSLAPLVERLTVGYPSAILREGIVLVDLPGLGVANDRYRSITQSYIREKASAVLLVVDRAGPTESSVELLRDSGYWERLLLSSSDPETDPCSMLMAVTRVDDVAEHEYTLTQHLPKDQRPKKSELFLQIRLELQDRLRVQATECFATFPGASADNEDVKLARLDAKQTLLSSLQVFPLSATQYRRLLQDDEDDRSFLKDVASSGVPELVDCIRRLAKDREMRLAAARETVQERLISTIDAALGQIAASWSAESRAEQEATKLRQELDRFLEPLSREAHNRYGGFYEFLDYTGTTRITDLVEKAQSYATVKVEAYLQDLKGIHWSTLRATVNRGGAHVARGGRRIDLAADIAQEFQEPMAAIWGRTLLRDIRNRTRAHAQDLEKIIGDICTWADARSDTAVQKQTLVAQRQLMKTRVAQLSEVGNEAVDDLKSAIKRDLSETIQDPIRKRCEAFRASGDAIGPGVRDRMIQLFRELANEAVASAAGPAATLLRARFVDVKAEIQHALSSWGDPIQQAADAIAEREDQRRLRSDAQRRNRILSEVAQVKSALPRRRDVA
jgi:hypothetical protein